MSHNHRQSFVPQRSESRAHRHNTPTTGDAVTSPNQTKPGFLRDGQGPFTTNRPLNMTMLVKNTRTTSQTTAGSKEAIKTRPSFERPRTAFAPGLGSVAPQVALEPPITSFRSPEAWPSNQLQLAHPKPSRHISPPFVPTGLLLSDIPGSEFKAPAITPAQRDTHMRDSSEPIRAEDGIAHVSRRAAWDGSLVEESVYAHGTKRVFKVDDDTYLNEAKRLKTDTEGMAGEEQNFLHHGTASITRERTFVIPHGSDDDRFPTSPPKYLSPLPGHASLHHQELPTEGVVLRVSGFAEYVRQNQDTQMRSRKKWSECTMEEWYTGGDEIVAKFAAALELGKSVMEKRIKLYQQLAADVDSQRSVLDERSSVLKDMMDNVVRGGGNVLAGGPTSDD